MNKNSVFRVASVIFIIICLIFISPSSAEDFYAGDVISLGGSSPSDYVYLFVAGPNLPSGGANPEDIQSAVVTDDPGSFVRVTVNSGRWNYKWDTSTASGTPDPGLYRVYAASRPVGLNDISSADYSMTVVKIVRPYVTAGAEGGMITAKTGVVAGTGGEKTEDAISVMKTESESESGAVSVSSMENISDADAVVTGTEESAGDVQPSSSEKSALPAGVPVLAIGILFLVFFVLRKKD
ncbi:hypothetical protein [Methanoplanus limicola]|uniref:hypothetical protein n=1 Tax=Methanoplanus limicola TaxID=2315 RepID=UPI0012F64CB9|nr:hypothetical protein [Methanoplanus limicola]